MTQGMRTKRWTSNKIREMAVCVLTRFNHTYGKGYHGSGSLFPFILGVLDHPTFVLTG